MGPSCALPCKAFFSHGKILDALKSTNVINFMASLGAFLKGWLCVNIVSNFPLPEKAGVELSPRED